MTTRKLKFAKYFAVVLFTIVAALLVITACGGGTKYSITWTYDANQVSVTAEDYKELPTSVKDNTTITFTVTPNDGYKVVSVKNGKSSVSKVKDTDNTYSLTVIADAEITIESARTVEGVTVTLKNPDKIYYAGNTVDKENDLTVSASYGTNETETVPSTGFSIIYQNGSSFSFGDTSFKVRVDDKYSDDITVPTVKAQITLDPNGGELTEAYVETLKATFPDTVKTESGSVVFSHGELTSDISLPTNWANVKKGSTEGDFTLNYWEGVDGNTIAKSNVESLTITANWSAHLVNVSAVKYELRGDDQIPTLVVTATFRAAADADDLHFYFYEGNKGGYENLEETYQGERGVEKTLEFNMFQLVEATAQDGGNFAGPWLSINFRATINDEVVQTSVPVSGVNVNLSSSVFDAEEAYRFGFANSNGALMAEIKEMVPYTYEMSVDNADNVLTVTFTGTIVKRLNEYKGKYVYINFEGLNASGEYGQIADDGKWSVTLELSPENGYTLGSLGYGKFTIVESPENPSVVYKEGDEGNLLSNADVCLNSNTFENHADEITDGNFSSGKSLRVAREDETLVYFIGNPWWDAIVIWGYNPREPKVSTLGDVALRVDNVENPTKVYYGYTLVVQNLTEEQVKSLYFGNDDGNLFPLATDFGYENLGNNTYKLWYDITAYDGSQLWPNIYLPVFDAEGNITSYTKLLEIKDSDHSVDGLYAIVGDKKYVIHCASDSPYWDGPCVVVETPEAGEKNPDAVDPDFVPKSVEATRVTLEAAGNKAYLVLSGKSAKYTKAELETFLNEVYFDMQKVNGSYLTDFTRTVSVADDGSWTMKVDITSLAVDANTPYIIHFLERLNSDNPGQDVKLPTDQAEDGFSVHTDDKTFTIANRYGMSGAENYYGCVSIRVERYVAPDLEMPEDAVYAATNATLKVDGETVYFVLGGTYSNCTKAQIERFLTDVHFDLALLDSGNHDTDFVRTVTVSDSTWEIAFNVTNLAVDSRPYVASFLPRENHANPGQSLRLPTENAPDGYSVTAGQKVYTMINKWEDSNSDSSNCYRNISIKVELIPELAMPENAEYPATAADIALEDGKVYFILSGTYSSCTVAQLENFLEDVFFSFKRNGYNNGNWNGDWTEFDNFARTVSVNSDNGTWEIKFDVTDLAVFDALYTAYFLPSGGGDNAGLDLKLENAQDGKSVSLGDKKYTLVNKFGSNDAWDSWGNIALSIQDADAENIANLTVTTATLEKSEAGDKAYFVLSGTYTDIGDDDIERVLTKVYFDLQQRGGNWTSYSSFARTVSADKTAKTWTIKFDVTDLPADGNPYTGHFKSASTDLKLDTDHARHGEQVTLENGASYTISNVTDYEANEGNNWGEQYNWGCVSLKVESAN